MSPIARRAKEWDRARQRVNEILVSDKRPAMTADEEKRAHTLHTKGCSVVELVGFVNSFRHAGSTVFRKFGISTSDSMR